MPPSTHIQDRASSWLVQALPQGCVGRDPQYISLPGAYHAFKTALLVVYIFCIM
jgi:hypothetical protein